MGNQSSKSDDQKAKTATSVGIGVGLVITSVICPPLGAAATFSTLGTGIGMKVVGSLADEEGLEEAGDVFILGAEIGGVGNTATRAVQGSHAPCGGCKSLPKAFK
ncbi:11113_t:CDS:1 [Funneliformis caledonium]|uniref:11113_t:CDS:1 n=1 Tax=Funneliformis caledonium TaxID=1117310 RepID=A0A9N8WFP4_9GLOM|nr:11113_t:CDS:1 [Funneliformis caledonium]